MARFYDVPEDLEDSENVEIEGVSLEYRGDESPGGFFYNTDTGKSFRALTTRGTPSPELKAFREGAENIGISRYLKVLGEWESYDGIEVESSKDEIGFAVEDEELREGLEYLSSRFLEEQNQG